MRLLCIALAAILAGPAAPVFSDPQAETLFQQANERYAASDFAGASEALRQAYEIEPIATLLYSRAQVERRQEHWREAANLYQAYLDTQPPDEETVHARRHLLFAQSQAARLEGNCEDAVPRYERYLEQYPDTGQAADARVGLDACEETLALAAARDPEPDAVEPAPPPVVVRPPPVDEQPIESEAPAWYRSVAGGVLAGVGVAGVATGATLVGLAYRDHRLAEDEPTHDGSSVRYERARSWETAGTITLAVSGAALLFAGLAYGLAARRSKTPRVSWGPGGLQGRF